MYIKRNLSENNIPLRSNIKNLTHFTVRLNDTRNVIIDPIVP